MERIIRQIIAEQQNNFEYQMTFDREYYFFKQLFCYYCPTDMRHFLTIHPEQILAIILIVNNIKMPFEELMEKTKIFENTFNEDSDEFFNGFYQYIDALETITHSGELENYVALAKKYGDYKYQLDLSNIEGLDKDKIWFINASLGFFLKAQKQTTIIGKGKPNYVVDVDQLDTFIELYQAVGTSKPFFEFWDALLMASILKSDAPRDVLSKVKKEDINKMIYQVTAVKSPETCNRLKDMFATLERYWSNLNTKKTKLEKAAAKKARNNQEMLRYLNSLDDNKPIVLNETLLRLCTTPEIKVELLLFVNKHNLRFYAQTLEVNQQYKNSAFSKLELLFIKYGFKFEKLSVANQDLLIEKGYTDEIESILKFLSKNNFGFIKESHKIFIDLLLYSSLEVLNNIATLVASDTITNKFVQENPTILVLASKQQNISNHGLNYEDFMSKIVYFKKNNINLSSIFGLNPGLFHSPLEELQTQLEVIQKYGLDISTKGLELLDLPELLDLVDNYIELGLGSYIQNNAQLISSTKTGIIDRIIISYKLGINIFNENHRIVTKVTNPNKFYVPEEQLASLIINYSTNYINPEYQAVLNNSKRNVISFDYSELLSLLIPYEVDELCYKFGDTLISKNRILRNLEVILTDEELRQNDFAEILFQSILYQSLITSDDSAIENIYNIVSSLPKIELSSKVMQFHSESN